MQTYQHLDSNPEFNQKDKISQRSTTVPYTYTQNSTPQKMTLEQSSFHLKKSTSTVLDSTSNQNLSYSFISNSSSSPNHNFTNHPATNRSPYQFKIINYLESPQYKSMVNVSPLRLSEVNNQPDKNHVSNHRRVEQMDIEHIIHRVTKEIKEKHLPQMFKSLKKDVYDDLHALRLQFNNLKDEQRKVNEKLESKTLGNSKMQQENVLAQTYLFLLQEKVMKLQTKFNDRYDKLSLKFQKQMQTLSCTPSLNLEKSFNIGTLKSSIPNIKLQYKESFIIKDCDNKSKINEQIIVSLISYNVDKLGYLLDSDNRYILDSRGFQIRLEQKHLKLLEEHRILYR